MPFEDVMGTVAPWLTASQALAAVGAELALEQSDTKAPPEIADAVRAVSAAAGIPDLTELPPPRQAMLLGLIRLHLHQAIDLLEDPARPTGWTVTNPGILEGYGRASAMVPMLIAAAHPDLAAVTSFLDVGTGVGLLAVAAAGIWPDATVVGIDPWEVALERARANVAAAGLQDRITLRRQTLADIDDGDGFDAAWVPTFFLSEADLKDGLAALRRAIRPGGWVALGRMRESDDPLDQATEAFTTLRGGGYVLEAEHAVALLEAAGFGEAHVAPPAGPVPLELVLGQRPPL